MKSSSLVLALAALHAIVLSPLVAHAVPITGPTAFDDLVFSHYDETVSTQGTASPTNPGLAIRPLSGPGESFGQQFDVLAFVPNLVNLGGLHISTPPIQPFGSGFFAAGAGSQLHLTLDYDVSSPHLGFGVFVQNVGDVDNPAFAGGAVHTTITSPEWSGPVPITTVNGIPEFPTVLHSAHVHTAIDLSVTATGQQFLAVDFVNQDFAIITPEPITAHLVLIGLLVLGMLYIRRLRCGARA